MQIRALSTGSGDGSAGLHFVSEHACRSEVPALLTEHTVEVVVVVVVVEQGDLQAHSCQGTVVISLSNGGEIDFVESFRGLFH